MEIIRALWEAKWKRPSRGDPRFEDVSLGEHVSDLVDPVNEDDANMLDEIDRLAALGLDPFEVL